MSHSILEVPEALTLLGVSSNLTGTVKGYKDMKFVEFTQGSVTYGGPLLINIDNIDYIRGQTIVINGKEILVKESYEEIYNKLYSGLHSEFTLVD